MDDSAKKDVSKRVRYKQSQGVEQESGGEDQWQSKAYEGDALLGKRRLQNLGTITCSIN